MLMWQSLTDLNNALGQMTMDAALWVTVTEDPEVKPFVNWLTSRSSISAPSHIPESVKSFYASTPPDMPIERYFTEKLLRALTMSGSQQARAVKTIKKAQDLLKYLDMLDLDRVVPASRPCIGTEHGMWLNERNVHLALLTAMLVASKDRADQRNTIHYWAEFGGVDVTKLGKLEWQMLGVLEVCGFCSDSHFPDSCAIL